MHKKFEANQTKIKWDCQLYTKAAPQESWSDLTLETYPYVSSFKIKHAYLLGLFDSIVSRVSYHHTDNNKLNEMVCRFSSNSAILNRVTDVPSFNGFPPLLDF